MREVKVTGTPQRSYGKCDRHDKSWWKFKFRGPHEYSAYMSEVWAFDKFTIWFKCKHCHTMYEEFAISEAEFVEMGLPIGTDLPKDKFDQICYIR